MGDAGATLQAAFGAIDRLDGTRVVRCSRLYRTPAWGVTAQADFVNAAALVETSLSPLALLQALLQLERDAGRVRSPDGSDRWGPRTLDLDLLLYGDLVGKFDGAALPHRDLATRAWVLGPLAVLEPDLRDPVSGASVGELWRRFDRGAHPLVETSLDGPD